MRMNEILKGFSYHPYNLSEIVGAKVGFLMGRPLLTISATIEGLFI